MVKILILLALLVPGSAFSQARCPSHPYWTARTAAGVPEKPTLVDLIKLSNLAVDATVSSFETCPSPVKGASIVTFVTFRVRKVLWGVYRDTSLTLPFVGGCHGTVCHDLEGTPEFLRGERVILFLRQGRPVPVTGWTDGVFRVVGNQVWNYEGRPVIGIDPKSGEIQVNSSVNPPPKPIEEAVYGYHPVAGDVGKPARLKEGSGYQQTATPTGVPVTPERFVRSISDLQVRHRLPEPVPGTILPAGTPFPFGPLREAKPGGRP